nr:immunoglobulin light chain junction region [Macaca mulatta]MPO02578.1 immunoglobulin light chain junction region [Macaca mulatta]
CQQHNSHPRTF